MTPIAMTNDKPKRRRDIAFSSPRPQCPDHGDTMFANGTRSRWTNYYCNISGCKHSRKRPHVSKHGTNDGQND